MTYSFYTVVEYYWNGKYASLCVSTPEGERVEMANAAIYTRYAFFKPSSPQQASTLLNGPSAQLWMSDL